MHISYLQATTIIKGLNTNTSDGQWTVPRLDAEDMIITTTALLYFSLRQAISNSGQVEREFPLSSIAGFLHESTMLWAGLEKAVDSEQQGGRNRLAWPHLRPILRDVDMIDMVIKVLMAAPPSPNGHSGSGVYHHHDDVDDDDGRLLLEHAAGEWWLTMTAHGILSPSQVEEAFVSLLLPCYHDCYYSASEVSSPLCINVDEEHKTCEEDGSQAEERGHHHHHHIAAGRGVRMMMQTFQTMAIGNHIVTAYHHQHHRESNYDGHPATKKKGVVVTRYHPLHFSRMKAILSAVEIRLGLQSGGKGEIQ